MHVTALYFKGKLLADGTIDDLKAKFEAGYQLTLLHKEQSLWDERISSHISQFLPDVVLKNNPQSTREIDQKDDPDNKVISR